MSYFGKPIHVLRANFLCFDVPIESIAYFRPIPQTPLSDFANVYCWPHRFRRSQLIRQRAATLSVTGGNRFDRIHSIDPRARRVKRSGRRELFPQLPRPNDRAQQHWCRQPQRTQAEPVAYPPLARTHKKGLLPRADGWLRSWGSDESERACLIIISSDRRRKGYTHRLLWLQKFQSAACLF